MRLLSCDLLCPGGSQRTLNLLNTLSLHVYCGHGWCRLLELLHVNWLNDFNALVHRVRISLSKENRRLRHERWLEASSRNLSWHLEARGRILRHGHVPLVSVDLVGLILFRENNVLFTALSIGFRIRNEVSNVCVGALNFRLELSRRQTDQTRHLRLHGLRRHDLWHASNWLTWRLEPGGGLRGRVRHRWHYRYPKGVHIKLTIGVLFHHEFPTTCRVAHYVVKMLVITVFLCARLIIEGDAKIELTTVRNFLNHLLPQGGNSVGLNYLG